MKQVVMHGLTSRRIWIIGPLLKSFWKQMMPFHHVECYILTKYVMSIPNQMNQKWMVKWLMAIHLFPHILCGNCKVWPFSAIQMSPSMMIKACGKWRCTLQVCLKGVRQITLENYCKKHTLLKRDLNLWMKSQCKYSSRCKRNCEWLVTDKVVGQIQVRMC